MAGQSPPPPPKPETKAYELTACSIFYAKPASSSLKHLLKPCRPAPPPTYILCDVSFTARPGEILAIVGPSGAGKTTLLYILAARTAPTSGRLRVNSALLHARNFRRLSAHVP